MGTEKSSNTQSAGRTWQYCPEWNGWGFETRNKQKLLTSCPVKDGKQRFPFREVLWVVIIAGWKKKKAWICSLLNTWRNCTLKFYSILPTTTDIVPTIPILISSHWWLRRLTCKSTIVFFQFSTAQIPLMQRKWRNNIVQYNNLILFLQIESWRIIHPVQTPLPSQQVPRHLS